MLPVGLALLAHDIPSVHAPIARLLHFANGKIEKRRNCPVSAVPLTAEDIAEHDRQVRSVPLTDRLSHRANRN
jgi:hypothetical protein